MGLIAGFFFLIVLAGAAFVALTVLAVLFKVVFRIALLPVALVFVVLKLVMVVVGAVVGVALLVALGPVLLVVAILALPLLLLGGVVHALV